MTAMLVVFVFIGTFFAAAIAVILVALIQSSRAAPAGLEGAPEDIFDSTPLLLRQQPMSTMPLWHQLLDYLNFGQFLKQRIDEAGLRWSVGRVSLAMLLPASLFFAALFDAAWVPPGGALAAACIGGSIPYWLIKRKRSARLRKIDVQFPDALDSLCRSMRAGHTLSSAVEMLASETPAPLGPELRKLTDEQRLGLDWNIALENFARRLPVLEIRLFVAAVMVQTRTGGKLTEVLERLSENIRESASLRGEIRSISAQGRLAAVILTILPVLIAIAMWVTNPSYIRVLFVDPRGQYLVWGAIACLALGHFVIGRIVDIKAPQ